MSNTISYFLAYILLLTIILFHEYGHFIIHQINKRNPKFGFHPMGFKVTFDLVPYNKFQYDLATFAGVVFGLLPLFFFKNTFSFTEMLILVIIYMSCCTDDLMKLAGLKKEI